MSLDPRVREYAETPDRFSPVPQTGSVTRFDDGRICIVQGLTWASISGLRCAEAELDDVIATVHAEVPAEKHQVWWLGPSTEPANALALLEARGFGEPEDGGPLVHSMALTREPPAPPAGVEVRRVATFDDFVASRQLQWEAFAVAENRREEQRLHLRTEFDEAQANDVPVGFLALLDGRPAATALAIPSDRGVFLIAGCTVPEARGRGLYRALVRARWDFAAARGTPALVTEAMPDTSYPILLRLGFVEVCTVRRLEERRSP